MKTFRPALLLVTFILAGCAGSSSQPEQASTSTWWNPISWSWSSLSPVRWFSSSLTLSEQGLGDVNGTTLMQRDVLNDALDDRYYLRRGVRTADGNIVHFWQGVNSDKQVKVELVCDSAVRRIDVMDSDVSTASGVKFGSSFSELYSKAFGVCQKGSGADSASVECKAPGSQHISYVYSGDWHGPQGLMPSDDMLKSWTLSKMIWRR